MLSAGRKNHFQRSEWKTGTNIIMEKQEQQKQILPGEAMENNSSRMKNGEKQQTSEDHKRKE